MNITLENIDAVNAVITAEIAPADYEEKVKKSLKCILDFLNLKSLEQEKN